MAMKLRTPDWWSPMWLCSYVALVAMWLCEFVATTNNTNRTLQSTKRTPTGTKTTLKDTKETPTTQEDTTTDITNTALKRR